MSSHEAERILERINPLAVATARELVNERFPAGWADAQTIPIATRFYARAGGSYPLPPLANLILSAKGAATPRVRTYLWLHLLSGRAGDPVRQSTETWIRVLNLLQPSVANPNDIDPIDERNAKRRFRRAITHAKASGWIDEPRRGVLRLQDPRHGGPWEPPSAEQHRNYMRERTAQIEQWGLNVTRTNPWFEADPLELPIGCFTNGATAALSGAGLHALIILIDMGAHADWRAMPYKRSVRYGLGYKPWERGVTELHQLGWLKRDTQNRAGAVSVHRYRLKLARLRGKAHIHEAWVDAWDGRGQR